MKSSNVGGVWGSIGSLTFLVFVISLTESQKPKDGETLQMYTKTEKQRYDGWYNNLGHPDWGSVESQLTRKTPAFYTDGVYMLAGEGRPSPRTLSQALMRGEDGMPSSRNATAFFTFFGQVVTSEILMASEAGCPIELHKIEIDTCDDTYDKSCRGHRFMPFHRAHYDLRTGQSPNSPREQMDLYIQRHLIWINGF